MIGPHYSAAWPTKDKKNKKNSNLTTKVAMKAYFECSRPIFIPRRIKLIQTII